MDSQKPNNFEEEWKKAFNDASFTPPTDMWERIEHDLKQKKRRPFLFFLRPSAMLSGVAATLVLALGGILIFDQKESKTQTTVINKNTKKVSANFQNNNSKTENFAITTPNSTQLNLSTENNDVKETHALSETDIKNRVSYTKTSTINNQLQALSTANFAKPTIVDKEPYVPTSSNIKPLESFNIQTLDNQANKNISVAQNDDKIIIDLALLKYHDYQYLGSRYTLSRNKLVFEGKANEVTVVASNDSKFWLGVQSGVSPFNPNMKLGDLNTVAMAQADAFATASNRPVLGSSPSVSEPKPKILIAQPQNVIRSGLSINSGVAMGYKISKKWNFESGIRYLRGNSTLNSNTYAFKQNGYVNTFFANYLMQNSANQSVKITNVQINTVIADVSQFGNRYQYLMIPLQIGYEIGLSKKIALNILAGVSTDIFLQNTIINDNSILEKSIFNASSDVYKPLNLSGLGGVRASYLISKRWQLNLGSSYQYSLFSGINNSTSLQMRLKMFGLNYGLNYRF